MSDVADRPKPHVRQIRDSQFASRLEIACDNHPQVPAYNQGRLTWLVRQFQERFGQKISPETARKWASGEARPRPEKMRWLAQLLEVDEAWLSIGTTPEMTVRERKSQAMAISGSANILLGYMQLDGAACAYPDERDPRRDVVDFYGIVKGAQYAIRAALATEAEPGVYKFSVPTAYDVVTVLGMIRGPKLHLDIIELDHDLIDKHKVRKGGYYEITVQRKGDKYVTDGDEWPRIESFAQRL